MKKLAGVFIAFIGVAFLCVSPAVAKPKPVALVWVKMIQGRGIGFSITSDSRSSGISNESNEKVYVTAIVSARGDEYAEAVAKNEGKWTLTGNFEMRPGFSYEGLLQGDGIDLIIPQANGKTSKVHFFVLAHEWRNLDQLTGTGH
jgi:hypothetical protein